MRMKRQVLPAVKLRCRKTQRTEYRLFSILLMTYVALTEIEASAVTLKSNMLVNGDFSQPRLTAAMGFYNWTIAGWSCSWLCELNNCQIFQKTNVGYNLIFNDCQGQVIDLNSINNNERVTQIVDLKSGPYLLSFNYYYPIYFANKKIMYVYFNQQLVFQIKPPSSSLFQKFNIDIAVESREGKNNLTFTMSGSPADGSGFNLNNITLSRIEDTYFQTVLNISLKNSLIKNVISVPAYRTLFGEMTNFFVTLDRMQLYFYHKRNYSYCWGMFLDNVNQLMALKGTFAQNQLDFMLGSLTNLETSFLSTLNFKEKYQDGDEFFINNSALIVYSLPLIVSIIIGGYIAFKILFHEPLSRLFRKYSMAGVLILCLCDGNIEQFTYYIVGQFLSFFSVSYIHKMVNIFILLIFYLTLFTALASFLWFKAHYRHLVTYFLDNNKFKLSGVLSATVDRGIVCLLFGTTHRLLLNYPDFQLIVLGFIQMLWIVSRCFFLAWQANSNDLIVWLGIGGSFLRILFQMSSFIYTAQGLIFLNEVVHKQIIYIFLMNWGLQFLLNILLLFSQFSTYFQKRTNPNEAQLSQGLSQCQDSSYKKQRWKGKTAIQVPSRKENYLKTPKSYSQSIEKLKQKFINRIKDKRQMQSQGLKPKFSIF